MTPLLLFLAASIPAQLEAFTYKRLVGEDATKQVRDFLGELEIPTIQGDGATLTERTIADRITKEYRFELKPKDTAVVIVSTKIRADLPKDSSVLDRMRGKYRDLSLQMGEDAQGRDILTYQFVGPAGNQIFETILRNAVYSDAFPYALATQKGGGKTGIGLSQFFVVSGRYFECAVFTLPKENETDEQLIARAKQLCTDMRTKIKIVK